MNRRNFFETSGRWFSTILLSSLAGYLLLQRTTSPATTCQVQSFCEDCLKFKGCSKTQATAFREKYPKRNK